MNAYVYHVLNCAVTRWPWFEKPAIYAAFLWVLAEALGECPMRILSFVLLPDHWHGFGPLATADGGLPRVEPYPPATGPAQEGFGWGVALPRVARDEPE